MDAYTALTRGGSLYTPTFITDLNQKTCIGCGRCYKVCPRDVFELVERDEDEIDDDMDDDMDDDDDEDGDDDESPYETILLGHIVRFDKDRKYPDNLAEEAVDILSRIIHGAEPLQDADQKAIDDLLGSL